KNGGYRYWPNADGDLSVTGWYVQAVGAGAHAGAKGPGDMTKGLGRFIDAGWRSPPKRAFAHVGGAGAKPAPRAGGKLAMSILRPESTESFGNEWREFLGRSAPGANNTYTLYYGVRVFLFLDGKVSDKWRKSLADLAAKQKNSGGSAGMIPLENEWAFR